MFLNAKAASYHTTEGDGRRRGESRAMDKDVFRQNLITASELVLPFSREFLTNPLPSCSRYLIFPNQSYDKNALVGDEQVYPEDTLPDGKCLGPFEVEPVVEYLWRGGKVPEWIDIKIYSYDERHTYLQLICCGRFTAEEGLLYHKREEFQPFHVCGPYLPPGWESVERSGKFDLFWREGKPIIIS